MHVFSRAPKVFLDELVLSFGIVAGILVHTASFALHEKLLAQRDLLSMRRCSLSEHDAKCWSRGGWVHLFHRASTCTWALCHSNQYVQQTQQNKWSIFLSFSPSLSLSLSHTHTPHTHTHTFSLSFSLSPLSLLLSALSHTHTLSLSLPRARSLSSV